MPDVIAKDARGTGALSWHRAIAAIGQTATIRTIVVICATSWVLTLAFHWPGNVSTDGTIQWYEARFAEISHGHPAFLSFVWHWLDLVYPSPGPVLAVELALLWAALAAMLLWLRPARWFAGAACVFLASFPFLTGYEAVVIKDVMAGNAALLGYCILLGYPRGRRMMAIGGAFAAFALAGLFRYQLWIVACPALAAIALAERRHSARLAATAGRLAWGAGVFALTILAADAAMTATLTFKQTAPGIVMEQAMLYDVAGVLVRERDVHLDVFARDGVDVTEFARRARALYTTEKLDYLTRGGRGSIPAVEGLLTGVNYGDIQAQWINLLGRYPEDFAWHRWDTMLRLFGLGDLYECAPLVTVGFTRSPIELWAPLHADALAESFSTALLRWRYFPLNTPLFRPITYVALSVVLGVVLLAARTGDAIVPGAMLLAAWLYWLSYVAMPVACDIRYSYFACAAVLMASLFWAGRRAGRVGSNRLASV